MKRKAKEPDLIAILQKAIFDVMESAKATTQEKLRAIELGTKLAAIQRKGKLDDDDSDNFFSR